MIRNSYLAILLLFLCLAAKIFSEEPKSPLAPNNDGKVRINAGVDRVFGYSQYGIGWTAYDNYGNSTPIGIEMSRLKYPLDSFRVFADLNTSLSENLMLSIHFDKNLTGNSGKMEDSDWGVWWLEGNSWASPNTLDIFSTSDTNENIYSVDGSLRYKIPFNFGFIFSAGLRFIYQHFYFEVSNVDQYYPSYAQYAPYINASYASHALVSGIVGTYTVDYYLPMAEVAGSWKIGGSFFLDIALGFSPIAIAKDDDNHLLRSKESTGDSKGFGLAGNINARYYFMENIYLGINARGLYISTSGKTTQRRYATTSEGPPGFIATIDEKLESANFSAGLCLGISF